MMNIRTTPMSMKTVMKKRRRKTEKEKKDKLMNILKKDKKDKLMNILLKILCVKSI